MTHSIQFDNGAAYEYFMGAWSALVGEAFLEWLAVPAGLRWADIGCGNGAFTERIVERCAPSQVEALDFSEAQLAFARSRPRLSAVRFSQGDAMATPFPAAAFDVAVMPLVIVFLSAPARGVAELRRIVRPHGVAAAYMWDLGERFPYAPVIAELQAMGIRPPEPPSPEASTLEAMQELWRRAGLEQVRTREIVVERSFPSFEDYWKTVLTSPTAGPTLRALSPKESGLMQTRLRARLSIDAAGRVRSTGLANAVAGRTPT